MEKRQYGQTDMQVSVLGFGGAEIGFENSTVEKVDRLLGSALDAGLNVIDTGECYNTSEELIGKAVSHRRDDYYLFTKCGHSSGFDHPDWDPIMLEQSIERSLKRLQTDYLDILHLHSCSEEILRQGEVIRVLERARDAGKVRYIGYSGDNEAALYAIRCGLFDSLQTSVNIADQIAIEAAIPEAKAAGMGIIAKRPIANAAWRSENLPEDSYHQAYWERLKQLQYDFLSGDLQDAVGIALRFTLGIPGVCTAIVGTNNPQRWLQNAELLTAGPLSSSQSEAIRSRWKEVAQADWIAKG